MQILPEEMRLINVNTFQHTGPNSSIPSELPKYFDLRAVPLYAVIDFWFFWELWLIGHCGTRNMDIIS